MAICLLSLMSSGNESVLVGYLTKYQHEERKERQDSLLNRYLQCGRGSSPSQNNAMNLKHVLYSPPALLRDNFHLKWGHSLLTFLFMAISLLGLIISTVWKLPLLSGFLSSKGFFGLWSFKHITVSVPSSFLSNAVRTRLFNRMRIKEVASQLNAALVFFASATWMWAQNSIILVFLLDVIVDMLNECGFSQPLLKSLFGFLVSIS